MLCPLGFALGWPHVSVVVVLGSLDLVDCSLLLAVQVVFQVDVNEGMDR